MGISAETPSDAAGADLSASEPPSLVSTLFEGIGAPPAFYELTVPGDPVPWSPSVKLGSAPDAPRKMPGRQERHAGKIVECWERACPEGLWLEKGQPVELYGVFFITRPKTTQYRSGRFERELKPAFLGTQPTGKPDLSNLLKMVEDALTKVVWADDDQVVRLSGRKVYIDWWKPARSMVRIAPG